MIIIMGSYLRGMRPVFHEHIIGPEWTGYLLGWSARVSLIRTSSNEHRRRMSNLFDNDDSGSCTTLEKRMEIL